ncbi:ferredoxin family 2Fe-2S iron-sulfur cluster binding protein [Rickettsia endosymbiont of Cardiosporidium cionae]|uniref:ferredoxin family 2Fe-2S iron-sulfur cluster binding protein n=1 Tax=Rickettsia endosymbiont of Cardiosporidium cionae TaxID=2777155 RepID=UPI001894EADA|nr:ferredoxin family 2Fe-2S iron-sulfur cluster binding protein [Rickettsia endosymbiont of Cardiosporidium cionae]KAF8818926.1 (2Fe-2S) ferredoxin [Rickettsia endosymbiont of Cardiosporidium cionae]
MSEEKIRVTFITKKNEEKTVDAMVGLSILEVAHMNDIDLEGACEGSLACATCHVILEEETYNNLTPPEEEEEDMLDLAFGLTQTSRLGCQIILTKELDGIKIRLPALTRNINI